MNFKLYVRKVEKLLTDSKIPFEMSGDEITFSYAPTCTIYTNNCTIEIFKKHIKVNEIPIDDISDLIETIEQFEVVPS